MSTPVRTQRTANLRLLAGARLGIASAALLASSVATLAATNLVANGSFESPILTPGSDYLVASVGSSTITGWAVVGSPGQNVAMIEALYNLPDAAGINFAAADGVQWIDMTGAGSNSTEGLQQSVTLAPGSYTLSFYVGNVVAAAAGLGTQSTIDLWLNSSFVQSFTNSGSGGTGINWQQFSYAFIASGLTSIEFRNADGANDNFNGLDHVFLTAVPEPSMLAMSISGLLFLGVWLRRRPG